MIYETHVQAASRCCTPRCARTCAAPTPGSPPSRRSSYLRDLGVTAVELLPVHHIADESFLVDRGLTNYWGYSTIGFFAPHSAYAATGQRGQEVREFKGMVKALHRAGIEVILDVVYNHTAEGNHLGPMLSFKGVDNKSYYRLVPDDPRHYMDYTGTGNTLNAQHPSVLRLIMDSLRYWVIECHVDGFRFDLASALGPRALRRRPAVRVLRRHPPGPGALAGQADRRAVGRRAGRLPGRQLPGPVVGVERHLPRPMRDFWRGQASVGEFASRLTGSSDLYEDDGRHPFASINFITAHDGFTLRDLVSYNEKHNEANLEDNRDGTDDNRSWNCGVEGETDDPEINALRARQQRNFLATLLLSPGHADAARRRRVRPHPARQQQRLVPGQRDLLVRLEPARGERASCSSSSKKLIVLRRAHPVFRRRQFLHGRDEEGSGLPDVVVVPHRRAPHDARATGSGRADASACSSTARRSPRRTTQGQRILDESFLLLFNAHHEDVTFTLPNRRFGERWALVLRTARARRGAERRSRSPRSRSSCSAGARWCCCARAMTRAAAPPTASSSAATSASPRRASSCRTCADLGVSHLYLPPSFQARPGSTHGYDVVDPTLDLRGARRRGGVPRARRRGARGGPGGGARHRPEPHGGRRREPLLERPELRAKFFDIDAETGRHRRFFDIDHLAGVRQEDPEVFEETHRLALRAGARRASSTGCGSTTRTGWPTPPATCERLRDAGVEHVWVEKILDPGEKLRDWPVDGTVGYEFLNDVAALFVDPAGEAPLTALWAEVSGDDRARSRSYAARGQARAGRDHLRRGGGAPRARAARATTVPERRSPRCRSTAPTSSRGRAGRRRGPRGARRGRACESARAHAALETGPPEFVTRFQQTTPPVMAKGVEDTAFYRYLRLLALNDVGGDPGRFGLSVDDFHAANAERARASRATCSSPRRTTPSARATCGRASARWPGWPTMGGARARLARADARDGGGAPDDAERYLVFQTLVGRLADRARAARRRTSRRRCARPSAPRAGSTPTRSTRRR